MVQKRKIVWALLFSSWNRIICYFIVFIWTNILLIQSNPCSLALEIRNERIELHKALTIRPTPLRYHHRHKFKWIKITRKLFWHTDNNGSYLLSVRSSRANWRHREVLTAERYSSALLKSYCGWLSNFGDVDIGSGMVVSILRRFAEESCSFDLNLLLISCSFVEQCPTKNDIGYYRTYFNLEEYPRSEKTQVLKFGAKTWRTANKWTRNDLTILKNKCLSCERNNIL